jgi:transcriptional regulator with XRE-family HTH domain
MEAQFSAWFRRQLDRREWNQREFARRAHVASSTVSNWYRGERVPDPAKCEVIAEAFGIDLDTVLAQAGHRPDVEPLDANDPRELLAQRVRRIHLREDDLAIMNRNLDIWEARNKREREEKL